jgi:hypothetical protein
VLRRGALPACLSLVALYLAVWPHELGHSTTAYLLGCKGNWWRTGTTWYLWNSQAGDVDYACLERQGTAALLLTDGAGIAVNLSILVAALVLARTSPAVRHPRLLLGVLLLALANYSEAFSYLVLNVLWLKSDMATVVPASGLSRWLWLAFGLAAAATAGFWLAGPASRAADNLQTPHLPRARWQAFFFAYVAIVGLAMATARIILT